MEKEVGSTNSAVVAAAAGEHSTYENYLIVLIKIISRLG